MIGLIEAEQRIRFNINLAATRQANLKLSSQLLKLATIVAVSYTHLDVYKRQMTASRNCPTDTCSKKNSSVSWMKRLSESNWRL